MIMTIVQRLTEQTGDRNRLGTNAYSFRKRPAMRLNTRIV